MNALMANVTILDIFRYKPTSQSALHDSLLKSNMTKWTRGTLKEYAVQEQASSG